MACSKRASFPLAQSAELRDLTRYRVRLTEEKAREVNRVQKTLEDTNLKLGDVVSDIMGKASRLILQARGSSSVCGNARLSGCLPRPIDVKDHPAVSCSIHQPSGLLVGEERATEQILKKEGAQAFNGRFC
jgi:hypothetical protein